MPELPEVETMRRNVLPIVGKKIAEASRTSCTKKPISIEPRIDRLNKRVVGKKVIRVDRLGKRVVIVTESEDRLIIEPRMTGIVLIGQPPNTEHLRFQIKFHRSAGTRLLFWDRRGLGTVRLLSAKQFDDWMESGKLGPDAIAITVDEMRQRADKSRREIKVALLDQKLVAGVGNLYASEILFSAGIDPRTRCDRLSKKQWTKIHSEMLRILNEAILYEGSTLSDGTYQQSINEPGGYQNHHQVYDKADSPCPVCAKPIRRIVQAQRSTFYCQKCQKKS